MPLSLRDGRTQLLAAYAALVATFYGIYVLPGLPSFRSGGELVISLAIDVALFVLIARGSRVALAIALGLNLFFFVAVLLLSLWPPELAFAAVIGVKLAESLVLVSLWRTPRAAATGQPTA